MKNIIFVFILVALFASCTTEKKLLKGNEVYTYGLGAAPAAPVPAYTKYKVIAPKKVKIVDNGTYLIIKDDPSTDPAHYTKVNTVAFTTASIPSWKDENIGLAYFSESADNNAKSMLWYSDCKFVLQTAAIPLKIRSAVRNHAYLDSFPSQVETGFNVGFLVGGKKTWNRFRTSTNIFGQTTDKFSVTGGFLLSTGGVDLSATSTRPKIEFPRKTAMISYGGAIVFGFNSLNFGYAVGWDQAVGRKANSWLYKGKLWNGIIISIDLIK